MMSNIYFISDTHFGHENILKFTDGYGHLFRGSLFESVDHMNEYMIEKWNATVKPADKVYHLGDVFICSDADGEAVLKRLNGHKRMILGNHDKVTRNSPHFRYFEKIMLWWPFENFIFSHIPLRENQFPIHNNSRLNVHGHIHQNPPISPLHYNVSVENIDYTPVHLDTLKKIYSDRSLG